MSVSNSNLKLNDSEVIISYLKNQEILGEGECSYEDSTDIERRFKGKEVRDLLECIVDKIEERGLQKLLYEKQVKEHNQFPLFELGQVIPGAWIDDDLYEQLTFRETLVISKIEKGSLVSKGGLCLDIQAALGRQPLERTFKESIPFLDCLKIQTENGFWGQKPSKSLDSKGSTASSRGPSVTSKFCEEVKEKMHRSNTKFLVHLSSQLDVDGRNGGSKLTAWVDKNLHTLEEKRKEYIMEPGENLIEKSLYMGLQHHKYFVKYRSRPENLREKKFYSLMKTANFVGEGASFVLMRFLAIWKYMGTFELSTAYINGDMCRNIYRSYGPEGAMVNGQRIDVCKIYRIIIEECGLEHRSCTVLSLHGQIIKHEWENSNYVLHINQLATISNDRLPGNDAVIKKDNWQDDMQLFSQYLDQKNTCSLQVQSYMLDHPELKNIVADYIQHILTLRPEDILEFTINHFANFAPHYFPRNDYYDYNQGEEEDIFTI